MTKPHILVYSSISDANVNFSANSNSASLNFSITKGILIMLKRQFSPRMRYPAMLAFTIYMLVCAMPSGASSNTALIKTIDSALADPGLNHSGRGVLIKSLDTGKTIYSRNSDILMVPASNFKLIVSSAALDTLGPDYTMNTYLFATSKPGVDGVLKGDLVLVGKGNPVLSFDNLQTMADKVKAMGIKSVEGRVIGDDTWFDDIRLGEGWDWDSQNYYYSAQVAALSASENYVDVYVRPGAKIGDAPSVKTIPATSYVTIQNTCTTGAAGTSRNVVVDRLPGQNIIRVTGNIPSDDKQESPAESITVEDPAMFACYTLKDMLQRDGIEVKGELAHGKLPEGCELITTIASPPMSEMIKLLLKPSDNLIAECLLKTLGAESKGKGTVDNGRDVELAFLKKAGADPFSIGIADGSGLSRKNCVSPKNLTAVLTYMYKQKNSNIYIAALPIAGVDGTLRNRMKGTPAQGNVRAKTGYVMRVTCLSGFVKTKANENLVFSIMLNNYLGEQQQAKDAEDRIMAALAGQKARL